MIFKHIKNYCLHKTTRQGFEFRIGASFSFSEATVGVAGILMALCLLLGWGALGTVALWARHMHDRAAPVLLGLWVALFPCVIAVLLELTIIITRETIRLAHGRLTLERIVFGRRSTHVYQHSAIRTLRLSEPVHRSRGMVCLDVFLAGLAGTENASRTRTIFFGKRVSLHDAKHLVETISEIMEGQYHQVSHIRFGDPARFSALQGDRCLQNPDILSLKRPYIHLEQVDIDLETYNVHQVEGFLTYAVNHLGQHDLKSHVVVDMYGDSEKLHPNLKNSLTHLCKQVIMHPYDHTSSEDVMKATKDNESEGA